MNAQRDICEENELIARIRQNGDPQALCELLSPYDALLRHLARRLLVPSSVMTQEELAQAGYVGLICAAKRFDAKKGVRFVTYAVPWALGEMRGALRSACAQDGVRMLSLDDAGEDPQGRPLEETLPGGELSVERVALRLALERLTPQERKLISLRFFEDRTQRETARLLQRSQGQVSRMESRALDRLRALLS